MEIYVLINNQPNGPYTPDLIRTYLASGQFQPTDLAAVSGSADWKPLSEMVKSWDATGHASAGAGKSPSKVQSKGTAFGGPITVTHGHVIAKKRSKFKLLPTITGLVVLLLIGGGLYIGWKMFGNSGPVVKVVTPLESGLPNALSELNNFYAEPPAGQNAATFYMKGLDALQITDADRNSADIPFLGKATLPAFGTSLSVKTRTAIAGLVQRNAAAFESFRQGVRFPQSRYTLDLSQGMDTTLPHLAKIKTAVQLTGDSAMLSAEAKQTPAATGTWLMTFNLAQSLKDEPVLISQLTRVSCLTTAMTNLDWILNVSALFPAQLEALSTALTKAESAEADGTPFTRSMATERAASLAFFDLPPDQLSEKLKQLSGTTGDGVSQKIALRKLMRNMKSQRALTEETFNKAIPLHKQPGPDRLKVKDYFDERMAEAKTNDFAIVLLLEPASAKQTDREATGLAALRLMQTAVALERYRAANANQYPDALSGLSPKFLAAVPQDPFNGQPLGYKTTDTGYELSSVGTQSKPIKFTVVKPPPQHIATTTE